MSEPDVFDLLLFSNASWAAMAPFLAIVLATVAGIAAVIWGLKKIGAIGADVSIGSYMKEFLLAFPDPSKTPQSIEGQASVRNTENTVNNNSLAKLAISIPEGAAGELEGGEDFISMTSPNTGNQLLA